MAGHDHDHAAHDHAAHDHAAHDHAAHDHGHEHHDHEHEHGEHEDDQPDISGWAAAAPTATCPACGAAGALTLGGGLFCPACGEISTNPGYQAPPPSEPAPEPDAA